MKAEQLLDCASVARDLLRQPEFFDFHRAELPDEPETRPSLALARYTGARSDDEAVNLRVGAMRLLGFSDRAIERECGVDRRTIAHRLAWLERARLLPAVKDRVSAITSDLAESSGLALRVLLDRASAGEVNIELAGMIKSVATAHGITVEKMQLLTGAATEILEVRIGAGRADVEAWLAANSLPVEVEVDSEATTSSPKHQQTDQIEDTRHAGDTSVAADQAQPAAAGPAQPEQAGGGVGVGGGGIAGDGLNGF